MAAFNDVANSSAAVSPDQVTVSERNNSADTLTEIPLEKGRNKKRVPRKILHFSDGTLEEYSTDDDEEQLIKPDAPPPVDPQKLTWPGYFWYQTRRSAWSVYLALDYCGESLASFFGITTPKYQYAIDEYNKQKEEELAEQEGLERELAELEKRESIELSQLEGGQNKASGDAPAGEGASASDA